MSKPMQKMIVTATVTNDGSIHIDLDFFPRLPASTEEYQQLSQRKQAMVAVINHIGKVNEKMINGLIKMDEENKNAPVFPLPDEVQNAVAGSPAPAQLPGDVQEEQDANTSS